MSRRLAKLRGGLSDIPEHIPGLSREGWTQSLASALSKNLLLKGVQRNDLEDREEGRGRFGQQKNGCSPDEINDHFKMRLEQPAPQPKPEIERNLASSREHTRKYITWESIFSLRYYLHINTSGWLKRRHNRPTPVISHSVNGASSVNGVSSVSRIGSASTTRFALRQL